MDKDAEHTHRIGEMHRRIGRNLLRFQQIEHDLKFLMPYIHPRAHADGLEGFTKLRGEITNKTLGDLIARIYRVVQARPTGSFSMLNCKSCYRAEIQVVHHFMRLPEFDLDGSWNYQCRYRVPR